jgi:fermentation-respiration switch protein FrsA (DUF1100 family)
MKNRVFAARAEDDRRIKEARAQRFFSREKILGGLVSLSFLASVSFFGLRWLEKAVTFHPVRYVPGNDWSTPLGARDVWFTTSDGYRLHGWFFQSNTEPNLATIIYFHGNGGNITNVDWVGKYLASRGFAVLLFDYRGYGRSEGESNDERGIYQDADAAYEFVKGGVSDGSIVLYGQSLGTAAVADLASRRPCGAIILESGLSSASDLAATVFPWFPRRLHVFLRSQFESARKLPNVRCPVLITHGDPDPVIPTNQSRLLYAAASEPKKLIIFPGAGHNVFGSMGNGYLDVVSNFIRDALAKR